MKVLYLNICLSYFVTVPKGKREVGEIYQAFGDYDFLVIMEGRDASEMQAMVKGMGEMRYVVDVRPILISPDNWGAIEAQAC